MVECHLLKKKTTTTTKSAHSLKAKIPSMLLKLTLKSRIAVLLFKTFYYFLLRHRKRVKIFKYKVFIKGFKYF